MVSPQYSYSKVAPSKITEAINQIFADMKRDAPSTEYSRSANRNVLILSSSASQNGSVDALIDSLALVHPSRFFVAVMDESAAEINVELAARCFMVSKNEHACSEIIRMTASSRLVAGVASLVRGNLLSGMAIELCLFDPAVPLGQMEQLARLADMYFFDSGLYDSRPDMLEYLAKVCHHGVDAQWLGLAPWRDEIRYAFDRPATRQALPSIKSIQIDVEGPDPDAIPSCGFLMAGWLADRLNLDFVSKDKSKVMLSRHGDRNSAIQLNFARKAAAGEAALQSVRMTFGDRGEVFFSRDGNSVLSDVRVDSPYKIVRPLDEEGREASLKRYFLIGESTANYPAAFRIGLRMR